MQDQTAVWAVGQVMDSGRLAADAVKARPNEVGDSRTAEPMITERRISIRDE